MSRAIPLCIATCFALSVNVGLAVPLTLTVNPSLSSLGGAQITGSILSDFDAGAQSLTFGGGSNISVSNASGSGVIPQAVFSAGLATLTASGSYQANVAGLSFDLISGTVINGSAANIPVWTGAGAGSLLGTLDLEIDLLGSVTTTTVSFSALLTPLQPEFTSSAGLNPIALSITAAGITLSLPFDVPFISSTATVSGGGLSSDLLNAVAGFVDGVLSSPVVVSDGLVVASDVVNAPAPGTLALLGLGLAGLGWSRRRK